MSKDLVFHIGLVIGTVIMGFILKDPAQQISNFICLSYGYWGCRLVWWEKKS